MTDQSAAYVAGAECCVCDPAACAADETGDHCIDRSCDYCMHGCPAGERPCCLDGAPR